ncbi:MAG: hypothetical protein JWN03_3680 [Nocardia sp.]|uniref:DUF7373 family lipoprotein n=1 Tax=Nocardia sp. TaxID=1821 RepID=UPI00260E1856|nr:hypothetical protein [Nocardia sp.]MCU1643405.1 hypothetical protein [Nocardia sp.]
MRFRLRGAAAAAVGFVMLAGVAACGGSGGDTPDYGPYSGKPGAADYDQKPSRSRGVLAESLRLGEHILYATDIDPELKVGRGGGVFANYRGLESSFISGPESDAADGHGPLAAFGALAANKSYAAGQSEKFLAVSLLEFPDEAAAGAAAADMDRADFQANADNAPVAVDAFPAAINHWRPGIPTLGSVMAYKSLVIRVYAQLQDPDLGQLIDMVTRSYQRQIDLLANYTPTPAADLPKMQLDPDKLLTRVVQTEEPTPTDMKFVVYGVHAYSVFLASPAEDARKNTDHGVTEVAVSYNKHLFKMRDEATAKSYAGFLGELRDGPEFTPMKGVSGLADVTCGQLTKPVPNSVEARRFRCIVMRGEYVAMVYSNTDTDVRQLAAAQYSVMGGTA